MSEYEESSLQLKAELWLVASALALLKRRKTNYTYFRCVYRGGDYDPWSEYDILTVLRKLSSVNELNGMLEQLRGGVAAG